MAGSDRAGRERGLGDDPGLFSNGEPLTSIDQSTRWMSALPQSPTSIPVTACRLSTRTKNVVWLAALAPHVGGFEEHSMLNVSPPPRRGSPSNLATMK